MRAPESITPLVKQWLRGSIPTPPDAERSVDEVMNTLLRETQVRPRPVTRFLPWRLRPDRGFSMFTFTKIAAATAVVVLASTFLLGGVLTTQTDTEVAPAADAPSPTAEVLFDAVLPTDSLPPEFVKVVADRWILAPGSDSQNSLTNEGLRGRGIIVDGGEFLIEPAADAWVWYAGETGPVIAPKGEALSLGLGDAIFLPAIPVDEVDTEATLRVANLGTQEATAFTFHTHDHHGGSWLGFPEGVELGDWDWALPLPTPTDPFNGSDVHFRLSRLTGEPGTMVPLPDAPGVGLYYVESGTLDQVTTGPKGDFTFSWEPGRNGFVVSTEGLDKKLEVTGDVPASVIELTVVPVSS